MEASLFHHSISVFVVLCSLSLFFHLFSFYTQTQLWISSCFWFIIKGDLFFLHGCQQQQIPVLKRCSVQVCCHKGFLFFSFKLFVLSHVFFPRSRNSNLRFHVNIDAVQNFSTTLLMRFPWCWCCDDRKLKLSEWMPLIPLLFFPSSLLFLPQWPNCIYAARWTKKRKKKSKRGNFYMLRRFSPRQISKIELLKKQKMMKENIQHFCFIFLWFCHWNLSQTCLYEAERRERVRRELTASPAERKPGGCTLLVCVWVLRAWVRVLAC